MAKRSTNELIDAFNKDGYDVTKEVDYNGNRGLIAEHRSAYNYQTLEKKRGYYVEGDPYAIGYLMGLMAPAYVERMANDYMYNMIPAFIHPELEKPYVNWLWKAIISYLKRKASEIREKYPDDIPREYADEMNGLVAGCKSVNPRIKVDFDKLWLLNTGFDMLLAYFYTGFSKPGLFTHLRSLIKSFKPGHLQNPIYCNGFSLFGNATKTKKDHYFGRDFMFINAGVFQDAACMTIYYPEGGPGKNNLSPIPFISVMAPGFIGSATAMNNNGIAAGVNVAPAAICNSERPGLNSTLLIRHCGQYSKSAEHATGLLAEAQRGVSYIYCISDGENDRAVVVEAGMKQKTIDFLSYPSKYLKKFLPDQHFIDNVGPVQPVNGSGGLAARWNDYEFPGDYLKFNKLLFKTHGKVYEEDVFMSETGCINKSYKDTNCPRVFYFAPQRENRNDFLLATNHFLVPQMRLTMMNRRIALFLKHPPCTMNVKTVYDEAQWRYDILNKRLLTDYGEFDFDKAQSAIDLLNPDGQFPGYYDKIPASLDGKTKQIEGSLSICDLKAKIIRSHFGYFADEWIQITLPNYV